jgi:hypothetical protein
MKKAKLHKANNVRRSCISPVQLVLRHGFPNGKHDGMPMYRMKYPSVDYVMNCELTKFIKVIEVEN